MTEAVTLNFEKASASDIQRVSSSRSSKYTPLVVACAGLKPEEAIRVPIPDTEDPQKMRINVSNAIRGRVPQAWAAEGKSQHVRIVRGADSNGEYIAVVCKAGVPPPRAPRKAKAAATKAKKGK